MTVMMMTMMKLVFTGKKKGITPVASFSALDKEGEDPMIVA